MKNLMLCVAARPFDKLRVVSPVEPEDRPPIGSKGRVDRRSTLLSES